MSVSRIPSGLIEIDKITGGYPKGSVISYLTNHSAIRILSIAKYIEAHQGPILFITTMHRPKDLIKLNSTFMDDKITFLDAISWRYKRINSQTDREFSNKYDVSNLMDLNNLFSKITQACKDIPISCIVFDTPSNILLYSTPSKEQVYRFFELFSAYTHSKEIDVVYTLDKTIHNQTVLSSLRFLSDGTIEFKQTGNNCEVMIQDLLYFNEQSSWISLD